MSDERSTAADVPPVATLSDEELDLAVREGGRLRGPAMFELIDRGRTSAGTAELLGALALHEPLRHDRLFHLVSAAWAAIIGLLSIETPRARQLGYEAFYELPADDRAALLAYLRSERIEDAHPQI